MKKSGLKKRMAILLILLAGGHMTARPGVIITGLLDGTLSGGCPKVIEIFVTGTENLNYYEIWRSLNGAPFGSGSGAISSMSGTFTNTFVYLVKTDHVEAFHDVFGNEGIFANVVPMGIVNGNGNDGFQVRLKVGSVVIDQVWMEDATYSYEDSYWYRKHGTGPDGGWLTSAWETPGNDELDGLDQDGLQAAVPFGTYAATWQGLTADWNNAENWSLGIIPSLQTNVVITWTSTAFPVINNPPDDPAVCMNLTVADSGRLMVNAGNALTVLGNLYLEVLSPETNDRGLILKSDNDPVQTGSLIFHGNSYGTAKLQRHIAKDNGWHFLSSPISGQAFQQAFVPDPLDNSFDLYYWDENASPGSEWINFRAENGEWNPQFEDSLLPCKGYLLAYSETNTGDLIRQFSGELNHGNMDIPVGHSQNNWNLAGNPYSCALDWSSDGINKTLIAANTMYIWDPALNANQGGYRAHNGTTGIPYGTTSYIPAMQGFFVQSLETGNLSIDVSNDNPLVHGFQEFYKTINEVTENSIRLKIRRNNLSDETLIYCHPSASNQFDPQFDAEKMFLDRPGCPEIFSLSDSDRPLCINILKDHPASVSLGVTCIESDTMTFTAFDFDAIPSETGIFLEDKLAEIWLNLREQSEYRFYHDPLQADGRFILHFMDAAKQVEPDITEGLEYWCSGNRVYISNPENIKGDISLYALDGRCVEQLKMIAGNSVFQVSEPTGLYALVISTPRWTSGRKIFIY